MEIHLTKEGTPFILAKFLSPSTSKNTIVVYRDPCMLILVTQIRVVFQPLVVACLSVSRIEYSHRDHKGTIIR